MDKNIFKNWEFNIEDISLNLKECVFLQTELITNRSKLECLPKSIKFNSGRQGWSLSKWLLDRLG
jgi:hypothetical protein